MKYIVFTTFLLISSLSLLAQTNTFPASGNVGIGTTSPGVLLHVNKSSPNGNQFIIEGTGSGAQQAGIDFKSNTTTIGTIGFFPPWEFRIGSTITSGSYFTSLYSGGNETMRLTNGNVGIGTTSPSQKLDVYGNVNAGGPGGGFWQGYRSNGGTGMWGFQQNDLMMIGIGGNVYSRGFSPNAMGIFNASTTKEDLFLYNQNSPAADFLVLKNTGNVGIGTINPQAKLAVNGDIYSQKVKVTQNGWSDYVFYTTYRLRPLSEVEQYIQQYHHLPEVPSAAEVEKDGLDLGDNQSTLLKKIEELTLYLIEQNKKLEEQNKKQEELDRHINYLQQENEKVKRMLKIN